jgi:hypothetical protein
MSDKTSVLFSLGLETGITYETIISTLAQSGEYNAAPMGILSEDGTSVILRPFKATRTYSNLVATRAAVANFTDDPLLFLTTAMKNDESLDCGMFTKAKVVEVPRLVAAESFLELQVTRIDESLDRAVVVCSPIHGEVVKTSPKPYCRGRFAALEAVIHATRVKVFLEEGRRKEAESLIQMIRAYRELALRVCPNSSYQLVAERVVELVQQWQRSSIAEER